MLNQLFREQPSRDMAYRLIKCFGLSGFEDSTPFTREQLRQQNTVKLIKEELLSDLQKTYIQCKAKSYLGDFDEKGALTILRQILRVFNYQILSKSKCKKGHRYPEYRILRA